jgi:hypothetical protein
MFFLKKKKKKKTYDEMGRTTHVQFMEGDKE